LLKRYRQTLATLVEEARRFCSARGMSYAMVRSDASVEQLTTDYLRRRGLVR
jgi:hypothetical protein